MRPVSRSEIVDHHTYEDEREAFREKVLEEKAPRRVHVGPNLTFLFENHLTVRYQVQEMVRAEQLVKEADVIHELETYNELLGGDGELGCTLFIEIEDENERARKLKAWLDLPEHLYGVLEGGERIRFRHDPRQVGDDRLSSVQYLKLETGGRVPVALGVDHPAYTIEVSLTDETRAALNRDLLDE